MGLGVARDRLAQEIVTMLAMRGRSSDSVTEPVSDKTDRRRGQHDEWKWDCEEEQGGEEAA